MRIFILQAFMLGLILAGLLTAAWFTVVAGLSGELGLLAGLCASILLLFSAGALFLAGVLIFEGVRSRRELDTRLAWVLDAA